MLRWQARRCINMTIKSNHHGPSVSLASSELELINTELFGPLLVLIFFLPLLLRRLDLLLLPLRYNLLLLLQFGARLLLFPKSPRQYCLR